MLNLRHILKVSMVWVSLLYVICVVGTALFPQLRTGFIRYALHGDVAFQKTAITIGSFIAGLVWWNVIAIIYIGLFVVLYNKMKK